MTPLLLLRRAVEAAALRRFLSARSRLEDHMAVVGGMSFVSRRAAPPPGWDSRRGTTAAEGRPPVVLFAGLGLSGRYLLPLAAELATRHEVWVPDLPGFGRSAGPPKALDVGQLAEAAIRWMDAAGLHPAVLVGNSAGCQIAVETAVRHRDHVAGLVLEAPTIDRHARSVLRHLGRIAIDAFREPFSLWWLQLFDWMDTGPRRLVGTVRQTFAHRIEDRLALVSCPVLVIRGSRDPIVSQRWAEELASTVPDASLQVQEGAAHAMPYSSPERLAWAVTGFAATRTARPPASCLRHE